MAIDMDDVSLYTVDEAGSILGDLTDSSVFWTCGEGSESPNLTLPEDWSDEVLGFEPEDVLDGVVLETNGAGNIPLTKGAFTELMTKFGIGAKYALTLPPHYLAPQVNYWLRHGSTLDLRMLTFDGEGVGFTKSPLAPTVHASQVFEQAVESLCAATGTNPDDLRVDYKLTHTLKETAFRLIQPTQLKSITSARDGETKSDSWNFGLSVNHSVTAKFPTVAEGYMFAWWCTNGAIATHGASSKYDRRSHADDAEEFSEWFNRVTEDIVADTPRELETIQTLTSVNLKGEMSEAAEEVFKRYKVPTQSREAVIAALVDSDDWSAYGLMNAVTQAANPSGTDERVRNLLMRAGGDMAVAFSERCETCHRIGAAA